MRQEQQQQLLHLWLRRHHGLVYSCLCYTGDGAEQAARLAGDNVCQLQQQRLTAAVDAAAAAAAAAAVDGKNSAWLGARLSVLYWQWCRAGCMPGW
jgi:hypothetical protein